MIITLGEPSDRLAATDVGTSGSNFLALLPDAPRWKLRPQGIFSALLLCTPDGAAILEDEGDDPVCSDPEGADRETIHARILREAAAHLTLNR